MIMNLIPEKYKVFFENLVENNKEIKGVVDYFESLPDLTDEDINVQAKRLDELIKQTKK